MTKIKKGERLTLKRAKGRSSDQNRLYWALLKYVAEASHFETAERLHVALKLALGRYDLMAMPNGKVVPVPHSTAFDSMSHEEFGKYFDDAAKVICRDVLPGTNSADLVAEVEAMIGQKAA
jgi:hypothetical protein